MQKESIGPGEESVWDYPRPPRLEHDQREIKVFFAEQCIAHTNKALRCLETSHPPVFYIPPEDIKMEFLQKSSAKSYCEYKGSAQYWDVVIGNEISRKAAWSYPKPTSLYQELQDYLAFYVKRVDQCTVGDEIVTSQEGDFYGGWITSEIKGPFKGPPGTMSW